MNFDKLLRRTLSLHLKNGERDPRTGEAMGTTKMAGEISFRSQRGITLIELLIALFLTGIIGGALYKGLLNQSKSFIQEDQVAEAMQHCREATDQILRELRMAGYSMAYLDASGKLTFNDHGIVMGTVTVINGTTVTTNNDANRWTTDSLVIRRGDSVPWFIRRYKYKDQKKGEKTKVTYDERVTVRLGDPDYVLLQTHDRKGYRTAMVQEKGTDEEYANMKKLYIVDYTGSVTSTGGLDADYGGDGTCVKFKEIAFYIDTSSDIPTLMKAINGYPSQIVARNIEDLQIAYQDSAGTWYRGGSGTIQSDPPVVDNIRNVRINVLARSSTVGSRDNYSHVALEDGKPHPDPATGKTADGFIRRSLTTQVRARNFGVDIGSD
jgi:prepilin-type N-terminal cleavage/methylation domain-containing protein